MPFLSSLRRALPAAAALAVAIAIGACSPIVRTHGYTPRAQELEALQVGVDTRDSVQQKLGRPSTIGAFSDDDWYYISIRTETLAFYAPEVVEQRVVTVSFDAEGVVNDVGRYGVEDGKVINLVTRVTPTSGRRLTILQQIFSNIGRFEASE
ncbi:MAG: outer membrane protein assembly factor BamE [Pseudomonadota bacterium]